MGYSSLPTNITTPQSAIHTVISDWTKPICDVSVIGNHGWVLVDYGTYKGIVMIKLEKHDGEYFYKAIDESSFPYYWNCPLRILNASTNNADKAIEWRATCRHIASQIKIRKSKIKNLKNGDIFLYGDREIIFQDAYNTRQVIGTDKETGKTYRYHKKDIIF